MRLNKVFMFIDWTSIICFLVYVFSVSALPVLTKVLMTHLNFQYPITLALVNSLTIMICLWFWTLLSIFKPRVISFVKVIIPLSIVSTLQIIFQFRLLSKASLVHFQTFKVLSLVGLTAAHLFKTQTQSKSKASLVRAVFNILPLAVGIGMMFYLHPLQHPITFGMCVALAYFDQSERFFPHRLRHNLYATDLQFQLMLRSMNCAFLFILSPLLDMNFSTLDSLPLPSSISMEKVRSAFATMRAVTTQYDTRTINQIVYLDNYYNNYNLGNLRHHFLVTKVLQTFLNRFIFMDNTTCFFIYSTALTAFFAFVSIRVANSKLHPLAFSAACVVSSVPVFLFHFAVYELPSVWDGPVIVLLLAGAHHIMLTSTNPAPEKHSSSPDDDIERCMLWLDNEHGDNGSDTGSDGETSRVRTNRTPNSAGRAGSSGSLGNSGMATLVLNSVHSHGDLRSASANGNANGNSMVTMASVSEKHLHHRCTGKQQLAQLLQPRQAQHVRSNSIHSTSHFPSHGNVSARGMASSSSWACTKDDE